MNSLKIAALILLLAGCASAPTASEQQARATLRDKYHFGYYSEDFLKAIREGNLEAVMLLMATNDGYPLYAVSEPGTTVSPEGAFREAERSDRSAILSYLLNHPKTPSESKVAAWKPAQDMNLYLNGQDRVCKDDLISTLVSDAPKPEYLGWVVHQLAITVCPKSLQAILDKYPEAANMEIDSGTDTVDETLLASMKNQNEGDDHFQSSDSKLEQVIGLFMTASERGCKNGDVNLCKSNDAYKRVAMSFAEYKKKRQNEVEESAKNEATEKADTAAREKYVSSGQEAFNQACAALFGIKSAEADLRQEQEIGRTAGVVDMAKLHQIGGGMLILKKELSNMKAEYQKRSGHSFDPAKCKSAHHKSVSEIVNEE